jgi:uroporphyrinogen decarboxylase
LIQAEGGGEEMTSKSERLRAAIEGEIADRPPVALWRHFPVDDQNPLQLSKRTLDFQEMYDFDFIKVTPSSSFCLKDWGVDDIWRGNTEGTREYVKRVINSPEDWKTLEVLQPEEGALGSQLTCLEEINSSRVDEVPFIQTIFSPLAQAKNLAGKEGLLAGLHRDPEFLHIALNVITESTVAFIHAAKKRGIAGIFYAIQHANYQLFDRAAYAKFGEPYDRRILEAASDLWLNVLHLHGVEIMYELAETYPVQIVNWHDRETPPSLQEGKSRIGVAVCGGLQRWNSLVIGTPESVVAEALDAMKSTGGGRGHVLGTGCVVPIVSPRGNLLAARQAVEM